MCKKQYILGLDLGTSSLGWAVIVREEDSVGSILNTGSSVFPSGKTMVGSKERSNNEERRNFRQARRQLARRRLRKQHLLRLLIEKDMCPLTQKELDGWVKWDKSKPSEERRRFPQSPRFREWLALDPYRLRAEAVDTPLEDDPDGGFTAREKLGRILYSIIQHRGFLSSRSGKEDGSIYTSTMEKDGKVGIDETRAALGDRTLGQYLYSIAPKEGDPFSDQTERVRSRYTLREMYVEEFDRIWTRQAPVLGLDREQVATVHYRYFTGKSDSYEARRRLERYRTKDPSAVIETLSGDEHRFVYKTTTSLKEHLAGKIWYDKDGTIRFVSKESTLFWQRPLRSQKSMLDKCSLESHKVKDRGTNRFITQGPTVVSASHPYYELYRVLQTLLNMRTRDRKLDLMRLQSMLDKLLTYGKNTKVSKLKKDLRLTLDLNFPDDYELPGCPTISGITKLLDSKKMPSRKGDASPVDRLVIPFDLDLYTRIWEKLFFYDDNHLLAQGLRGIEGAAFVEDLEDKLAKLHLSEDYGNLSLHALRNILPYLLRGEELYSAVLLGGIRNAVRDDALVDDHDDALRSWIHTQGPLARGEMIDRIVALLQDPDGPFQLSTPELKLRQRLYHPSQGTAKHRLMDQLPPVENLRNPMVEQALWAMRRLVNYLLNNYRSTIRPDFTFDEIHVELARDLKLSTQKRAEVRTRQKKAEEDNDMARDYLRGQGLSTSRENLQKYKLYMELAGRSMGVVTCPYTGKVIRGLSAALDGNSMFQIEHIVPRTMTYDDSFANKTLCDADFNRKKGNLTPWQFYQQDPSPKLWGADSWEEVEHRAFRLLPYRKATRFVSKTIEDQLSGDQLVDTAYISRKAKEYLSYICPQDHIRLYPGRVTARLRQLWGLNSILSQGPTITKGQLPAGLALSGDQIPAIVIGKKKSGVLSRILPKYTSRPEREERDVVLLVRVQKGKVYSARYSELLLSWDKAASLADGTYYIVLRSSEVVRVERMFTDQPRLTEDQLRARVTIELNKDGQPKLSSREMDVRILKDVPLPTAPGNYWLTIPLVSVPEVTPEHPRAKVATDTIKVSGSVEQGVFVSKVYRQGDLAMEDGLAQVILTPDLSEVSFTKIKLDAPAITSGEVVLTGAIDRSDLFVCDQDDELRVQIDSFDEPGKYYAVFSFDPMASYILSYDQTPNLSSDEVVLEGDLIYNDKDDRVHFSPAKNRDDHRHHALDAIVIACTGQGVLTAMSTYNAHADDYERGTGTKPTFASPWEGFRDDVREAIEAVLVKHKQSTKILNKVTKLITKDGRTHRSKGLAVRGKLHKETFYGQRQSPEEPAPTMHYRVPITSITKSKQLNQVADPTIRALMIRRLQDMGVDTTQEDYAIPGNAFVDKAGNYTILLPNKRGVPVPVKKVRRRRVVNNTVQLDGYNKEVETSNNDFALIYEDQEGNYCEEVVTFWDSADRLLHGQDRVQLPMDAKRVVMTLRINDMFVIGMSEDELRSAIGSSDYGGISDHLYRVQKLSSMHYVFRLHRASTLNHDEELYTIRSFSALKESTPIKVIIDTDGTISIAARDDQANNHHQ